MNKQIKLVSYILIILSFINAIFSSLFLTSLANIIDSLSDNSFTYEIVLFSMMFLFINLLCLLLQSWLNSYFKKIFIIYNRHRYFSDIYYDISRLDNDSFIEKEISILTKDIEVYYSYYKSKLSIINIIVYILIYFIFLAITNFLLAIALIVLVVITSVLSSKDNIDYASSRKEYQANCGKYNANLQEFIQSRILFNTVNNEKLIKRIDNSNTVLTNSLYRYGSIRAKIVTKSLLLSNLSLIILSVTLFLMSKYNSILIGTFLLAFEYYEICLYSTKDLIVNISDLNSMKKIIEKFNKPYLISNKNTISTFNEITINNVNANNLVYNYNFKKNDKILILGTSGSGKTTLFNILTNMTKYTGYYLIDDCIASKIELDDLFYYNHNTSVFPTDFINNISFYGLNRIDLSIVNEILAKISMEYLLNIDDCLLLSDGEKQVVLFIRAIFQKETVLLLDEIFSNISPKVKNVLLYYLPVNKTILITDHHNISGYNNFKVVNITDICKKTNNCNN